MLVNLQEMSLDNNPICTHKYYKRNLIAIMAGSPLKVLDSRRLTVSSLCCCNYAASPSESKS